MNKSLREQECVPNSKRSSEKFVCGVNKFNLKTAIDKKKKLSGLGVIPMILVKELNFQGQRSVIQCQDRLLEPSKKWKRQRKEMARYFFLAEIRPLWDWLCSGFEKELQWHTGRFMVPIFTSNLYLYWS